MLRGASWGGSGIWSGCLLDFSLGRCFGYTRPGGDPRQTKDTLERLTYISVSLITLKGKLQFTFNLSLFPKLWGFWKALQYGVYPRGPPTTGALSMLLCGAQMKSRSSFFSIQSCLSFMNLGRQQKSVQLWQSTDQVKGDLLVQVKTFVSYRSFTVIESEAHGYYGSICLHVDSTLE